MPPVLSPLALIIAAVACAAVGAASMTPAQRETELFGRLDLDHPGLEAVKAAERAGDRQTAREALADYYRQRTRPHWPVARAKRPRASVLNADTLAADRVLRRELAFVGRTAKLPKEIDWDCNPVGDVEWTCGLNQHGAWVRLGQAYWVTHDEKYAEDFVLQLCTWLQAYPRLDWRPNRRFVWRSTLRAAIRMGGVWTAAFAYFLDSPTFIAPDRISMLHSIAQHADYLLKSRSGGNWRLAESSGLYHIGVMFPEFQDAETWRNTAITRLYRELEAQVYPDGAQAELTPHYHGACMGSFLRAALLAKEQEVDTPSDYLARMEKMFEYCLYLAKPDLRVPMLNDSDYDSVKRWLEVGADLFGREDMRYCATGGSAGRSPEHTSHAFPYAGFYVMRSGWDRDARYLMFEAGPYGLGHQHEDKLHIDVYAYGRSLLLDPGRYTYVGGPWRSYFVGTQSHNTIVVDGQGQNRRRTERSLWGVDRPNDNRWVSTDQFDLAMGSYTDGYGRGMGVVHVRRVLFVKDDYWLVSDRLYERDPRKGHELASQFQFGTTGATVDEHTQAAQSHNKDANLLILPASPGKFRTDVVEGQTDPPRGWIGWNYHRNLKTPASMVTYRWSAVCPASADMVLYPYQGVDAPKVTVRQLAGHGPDVTALEVGHPKGFDRIVIQHRPPQPLSLEGIGTDAEMALVRYAADGEITASAAVNGSPVRSGDTSATVRATAVDEHRAKITWKSPEPVCVTVRYGHEIGGGHLFEKAGPDEPQRAGEVTLAYLTTARPYTFRVTGVTADGRHILLGESSFAATPPTSFDFETGDLSKWGSTKAVRRVERGPARGAHCLEARHPATPDVKYISVSRRVAYRVTPTSQVAFDYRTECEHPGKWYYFKINFSDSQSEDWSVYLGRVPTDNWQHVDMPLTDFRADTREHRNRAQALPMGALLHTLRFTQRKDKTDQASAQAFCIDNVRLYEAQ